MTHQHYPILAAYSAVNSYLREPVHAVKPAPLVAHDRAIAAEHVNFTRQDQWVMESATD